jgi:hypothetical protein
MRIAPETDQASLVLLGLFNPAIFQPFWFARSNLIGSEEAAGAEIEIIHPEVCKFQTDNYVIQVERERFIARSRSGPSELVKDLIIKAFGEYLPHTPVGVLGINRIVHFDAGSFEIRDAVGRAFAPWDTWGDWAPSFQGHDRKTHGGMIALQMRQGVPPGGYNGYVRALIGPSNVIPSDRGIYVDINHHYEIVARENAVGCAEVIAALEDQWHPATTHAAFIIDQVMKQVEKARNAHATATA